MEMSLTRALAEVKTLESRIARMIGEQRFIAVSRGTGDNLKVQGCSDPSAMADSVKSSFQAIQSLVARRNKIKTAIIEANAKTMLRVNGVQYSIASAIDRKHSITYENSLLQQAKRSYTAAKKMFDDIQAKLESDIDEQYRQVMGKDKSSKIDTELMNSIAARMRQEYEPGYIDPLGLEQLIVKMENDISEFTMNIDFALSEINASTKIVVPD